MGERKGDAHELRFGTLCLRRGNVWLSHLAGTWANEAQLMEEELHQGKVRHHQPRRRAQRPDLTLR